MAPPPEASAPANAPLLLVRHASTAWSGRRYAGRSDPPLDDAGRRAAQHLADEVAARARSVDHGPWRVVTSSPRRARSTAAPIATALGVQPTVDPRWAETDFGRFEGRTWAELEVEDPPLAARLAAGETDIDWPDGEPAATFHARVAAALADVLADGRPTVVVAHGGPIRLAVALVTGRPPATVTLPPPAGLVELERVARA